MINILLGKISDYSDIENIFNNICWNEIIELTKYLQNEIKQTSEILKCQDPETCPAQLKRKHELIRRNEFRNCILNNKDCKRICTEISKPEHNEEYNDISIVSSNSQKSSEYNDKETNIDVTNDKDIFNSKNIENDSSCSVKTSFRVSCRITGSYKSRFNSVVMSKLISDKISSLSENLQVLNSKNFNTDPFIDIYVNITDKNIFIGKFLSLLLPYILYLLILIINGDYLLAYFTQSLYKNLIQLE